MNIKTPAFVLEEEKLIRNLEIIRKVAEQADVEIILAFKGFSMWSSFSIIKEYIQGATASSLNEVKLCYEEMHAKAHTYCVCYKDEEWDEIAEKSSHITFNSINQFHQFSNRIPDHIEVGLRINPQWSDVETDLYNPSSSTSRLGMISDQIATVPDRIDGFHCHVLCESGAEATKILLEKIEEKFGDYLNQISWINLGGGHLMTRKNYDVDLLIQSLRSFKEKYQLKLILEPGSAFAWQAGNLETTVLDVVENSNTKTAIFDGSFTCHMPDCLEMPYRPEIEQGSRNPVEGWNRYNLGGLSCLAGDFLSDYYFEQPLKKGDRLTFLDMMHYTMVKTTMFNGVKHPDIVIKRKQGSLDLVKSFGYSDFKSRLS